MSAFAGKGKENLPHLDDLPTEVLLVIFKYCRMRDLGNLCKTCKRLNIVVSDFIWYGKSRKALVTNQIGTDIQNRSLHLLSATSKCRIACNWIRGQYIEKIYYPFKTKYLPWLVLEKDRLWVSKGNCIQAFWRKPSGLVQAPYISLRGHDDDVCRFVSAGGLIVSGGRDGSVCGWSVQSGQLQFHYPCSHKGDFIAVDMCGSVVVSGSHDETVKLWQVSEQGLVIPELSIDVGDRVWALSVQPQGNMCCVGSAGYHQVPPLHVFDMERGFNVTELECNPRPGAGVLAINWESPHEFVCGGYDASLQVFDIRSGRRVLMWDDPYDSIIYSIASDNLYTLVCGVSVNGRVLLWDKRRRQNIGRYYMSARSSSPVYGVAFDPCQLFAVLDQSLHVLDFSVFRDTPGIRNTQYTLGWLPW